MRTLLNRLLVKLGIHGKSHHNREEALLDYEASVMGLGCGRNDSRGNTRDPSQIEQSILINDIGRPSTGAHTLDHTAIKPALGPNSDSKALGTVWSEGVSHLSMKNSVCKGLYEMYLDSAVPKRVSNVEVNGPANIIMMLEAMDMIGAISAADYKLLREEAEKIIKYMKLLDNPNKVHWHDVI